MKKYFKIVYGYNDNQSTTVGLEEVPKAYHLFIKGEGRAIFDNGVALQGKDIMRIEPDWHATMGWNKTHKMDDDDWNEVKPLQNRFTELLSEAKSLAYESIEQNNPNLIEPQNAKGILVEKLKNKLPENTLSAEVKELTERFKI